MSAEENISQINERIKNIDTEIERLSVLKRKLNIAKEKLQDRKYLEQSNHLASNDWSQENYPWSNKIRENLQSVFKIQTFRSQQLETINVTMSKIDVILVAPTGCGKSLCFQLPAITEAGVTLVVSPLISLMEDQLHGLRKKGISAELLSMSTDSETVNRIHRFLNDADLSNKLKLLYVTPERMAKSKRLMSALQKCYQKEMLERIAIDEVHCCSILGHDFRPDYKYLGTLKSLFPKIPIIGVTATASRRVIIDVQKMLNIRGCLVLNAPFNRPNLFYGVIEKPNENDAVYDLLSNLLKIRYKNKSGIIYTFSIKDTETLVSELLQRDCKVRAYHASLEANQRSKVYQKWMMNEIQAVVATIAFGLGIDKPDVRFVIHHVMSKSIENFYQETGRCGRDGKYAESVLLYKLGDIFKISTMTFVETNGLQNAYSMVGYCINGKNCRRDIFSKFFTEVWSDKNCGKMCDHCSFNSRSRKIMPPVTNITSHYRTLLRIIENARGMDIKLTALKLVDAWFHKGPTKLRLEISPPAIDRNLGEQIVAFLIINHFLEEDFHYTAYNTISYIKKGSKSTQDEIDYQPSRICELPLVTELEDIFNASHSRSYDEEPESHLSHATKKQRIFIDDTDSLNDSFINNLLKDAEMKKLIDERIDLKVQKLLTANDREKQKPNEKSLNALTDQLDSDHDDVIEVIPKVKPEVIEID
ncbi:CLUMA_CG020147, isoform A [Clunio marinus]|uniref:ATP-dependent DNA helicase n=1 Tax=Clunio marinus TaxID=568069 RepID=A0A1J1J5C0_9DIPT|nr:CLUMA_CG020147, isoform A [Clunio marinus]